MLGQMPRSFVYRLRDIYYKQKMEEKRQNENHIRNNTNTRIANQRAHQKVAPNLSMDESLIEDMFDELS